MNSCMKRNFDYVLILKRGYELKFDCSGRVFDVVAMDKDTVLISVSVQRVSKTSNEFPP